VTVTVCWVPAAADVSPDTAKDTDGGGGDGLAANAVGAEATNRFKAIATEAIRAIARNFLICSPFLDALWAAGEQMVCPA
jgi:hypothetical protein